MIATRFCAVKLSAKGEIACVRSAPIVANATVSSPDGKARAPRRNRAL
jgi:hypothetical protein